MARLAGRHPMEQAYLEGLVSRLRLPAELVVHLESQVVAAESTPAR